MNLLTTDTFHRDRKILRDQDKNGTENYLKRANVLMNMHWNANFILKNPSAVIQTHLEKNFLKPHWTNCNSVYNSYLWLLRYTYDMGMNLEMK